MQKTRRGRVVVGAGALLLALAYAFATLAPALLGAVLLAYAAVARVRFRALLREAHFQAERRPPDATVYADEAVTLRSRVHVAPPGVRVRIVEPGAADTVVVSTRVVAGTATPDGASYDVETRIRTRRRGAHRLDHLVLELADPEGLFRHRYELEARVEFTAHAPRAAFRRGARARHIEALTVPRRADPGERSDEVLALRPYQPADRPRDIDWKASSRFDEVLTRTFLREVERPMVLVLDAGRTMRHRSATTSMLDDGARFVTFVLGAAWRQGGAVGFVAHDEHRLLHLVRPSRASEVPRHVADALALLPPPIDAAAGAVDTAGPPGGPRKPTAFEGVVAPLLGASAGRLPHGLTRSLSGVIPRGAPATVVVFTDLQYRPDETLAALLGAKRHQHRVVLAAPFAPWYHVRASRLSPELIEAVHRGWQTRQKTVRRLELAGVTVLDIAPQTEGGDLLKAVAGRRGSR